MEQRAIVPSWVDHPLLNPNDTTVEAVNAGPHLASVFFYALTLRKRNIIADYVIPYIVRLVVFLHRSLPSRVGISMWHGAI